MTTMAEVLLRNLNATAMAKRQCKKCGHHYHLADGYCGNCNKVRVKRWTIEQNERDEE